MVQQTTNQALPEKIAHPKRRDIFFHVFKTGNLIGSLVRDHRVSIGRKVGFFVAVAALAAILLFPDILDEIGLTFALPLLGTILGIPIDAGFDWVAFALVAVSLLKIFPKEIVGEHYKRIFHEV
jgi:hypothetical protein